ncbi:flagellar protein FlaG [Alcaligenaceae bacterium CGII-47]|nr:flagellar protein FlaG [Alcaligenaceae bacterium CGII-47]
MIDPIGNHLSALTGNPMPLASERAIQQAQPAVRVTSTEESHANGSSTSQSQTRLPGESKQAGDQQTALEKALELVNNNLKAWSTDMRFDIDEDAQRVVISIVDSSTGKVLRTVPSDAVLRVAKMIVQLQGTLVDTKA